MLSQITPLILTYNEAPNIGRTLERLTWARQIVVVDSGSTDDTVAIARSFPQVRVVVRRFDTFAGQCNFGLEQIRTPWVLSLDADYVLSPKLVEELKSWHPVPNVAGYRVPFRYCVNGRPLRATLYPPRVVLYRRDLAHYVDEGHGHRVRIHGEVQPLRGWIDHDDRKPLERWLREQDRYARLEAQHLLRGGQRNGERRERSAGKAAADAMDGGIWAFHRGHPSSPLSLADRIRRKIVFAPWLVFFYTLLGKGLILDGWPGWFDVWQRTYAEALLSLRLIEEKLKH